MFRNYYSPILRTIYGKAPNLTLAPGSEYLKTYESEPEHQPNLPLQNRKLF